MSTRAESLRTDARALGERMVAIRRSIHQAPELGLHTPETQRRIVDELARIGISGVRLGERCTSVVADVVGEAGGHGEAAGDGEAGKSGPCVALRADMDALPIFERTALPFASRIEGHMHACGHDAHVAMLLGAAALLHARRAELRGRVRLLFQPGEEGFGGARLMIDEGALDGVSRAFAIHLDPSRRAHAVEQRVGTMLAAFDNFEVKFRGAGGHASTPHAARDPIPAIGPFVDGLSHVVARETDPDDRAVLSVTLVRAGTADNVIPAEATCAGTIRSLTVSGRRLARERLRRVAEGVAASRGVSADVEIVEGYPPSINDRDVIELVAGAARALDLRVHEMPSPFMGAEDFSYVLERVPGALVFLGCRTEDGGPLHSDRMRIDESVLATGAALHAMVALRMLDAASRA